MHTGIFCILAVTVTIIFGAPQRHFRQNIVYRQQGLESNRHSGHSQISHSTQFTGNGQRTLHQSRRISSRTRPLKKIQIDPHSRTISISSHGQPRIIFKSRRGLKLKLRGRGRTPSKIINVVFRPRSRPTGVKNQDDSKARSNIDNLNTKNRKLESIQNPTTRTSYQNVDSKHQRGIILNTISGTRIRIFRNKNKELQYVIEKDSSNHETKYNSQHQVKIDMQSPDRYIPPSTVAIPLTTPFPLDVETEEPDLPGSA